MASDTAPPMLEGHTSRAFDGALAAFHMRVLAMGGLVLDQVREAVRAYTQWDEAAALRVLERERTVNAYDLNADEDLLALLARRQPMASDLRAIMALSKAVAELERAGDEAKKIAIYVQAQGGRPGAGTSRDARHLGRLAVAHMRIALDALDNLDPALTTEAGERDRELDAEYRAGLRRLLSRAMEDPRHFGVALEAAFVLKALERIGDHARNLARHVGSIASSRGH
jgi:phosphate transport system protein